MKLYIILLLSCLAYHAYSRTLVGSWSVNNTCQNYCCCPGNSMIIQIDGQNSTQVLVQSPAWDKNPICQKLGLTSQSSVLALPFSSILSLEDLEDYTKIQIPGRMGVVYKIESISKQGLITPVYTIKLKFAQASVGGQICSFTIQSTTRGFFDIVDS